MRRPDDRCADREEAKVQNHEYGLAIPLARLHDRALHWRAGCCASAGDEPAPCALQTVEQMLCPCIRGDTCVCRALARDFQARVRAARGRKAGPEEVATT